MTRLPPKAAIILWHGMDAVNINNDEDFAYAIMTLDRALDEEIPDWTTWDVDGDAPLTNILTAIDSQRANPLPESKCDGLVGIPWTEEQLNAILGAKKQ